MQEYILKVCEISHTEKSYFKVLLKEIWNSVYILWDLIKYFHLFFTCLLESCILMSEKGLYDRNMLCVYIYIDETDKVCG
jgi:hypothetical protein